MAKAEKTEKTEQTASSDVTALVREEVARATGTIVQQIQAQLEANKTGLNQLAPAYVEAVKTSRDAFKNAQNPHLRNSYADLGSVLSSVRDSFLGNGLWLMQSPGEVTIKGDKPYIAMAGLLLHKSGQSISFKMELPAFTLESKKNGGGEVLNCQTSGSALAYARRYMWNAVAGITQTDDDGDQASYVDGAEGPAVGEAPQASASTADLKKKIQATTSMDELRQLRAAAQATGDAEIQRVYLAQREKFQSAT